MKEIGIITYDINHLKTEQIILNLLGRYEMKVYALPFLQRPSREVMLQHRPDQKIAVHPRELCECYGLPYITVDSDKEIDSNCEIYLITGAGLLSGECLQGKRVLNCHPGVIPAARGLDAFKWSIFNMTPLGVTLHYIDEAVDAGEVVTIVPTPVFMSDSLESLARRHYESEIKLMSRFEECMEHPSNPYADIPVGESMRRMKREVEMLLPERFKEYKEKYAKIVPGGGNLLTPVHADTSERRAA